MSATVRPRGVLRRYSTATEASTTYRFTPPPRRGESALPLAASQRQLRVGRGALSETLLPLPPCQLPLHGRKYDRAHSGVVLLRMAPKATVKGVRMFLTCRFGMW